jgi:hypothetical protein
MSISEAAEASLLAAQAWVFAATATLDAAGKAVQAWFGLCVQGPFVLAWRAAAVVSKVCGGTLSVFGAQRTDQCAAQRLLPACWKRTCPSPLLLPSQ